MNRNQYITRRLLSQPPAYQDWVLAEATAQFRNADRLENLDFMDFIENGLDMLGSAFVADTPHNLCRSCLERAHEVDSPYCNRCH